MRQLLAIWDAIEVYLGGVLALAATAIVVYATMSRYLIAEQPSWTLEVIVYMIIWASFLMASHLMKEGGHVGADFLIANLGPRARRAIDFLVSIAGLAFVSLVFWLGVAHAYDAYDFGDVSATSVRFPMWIAYSAVPAGALLLAARLVQRLYWIVRAPEKVPAMHGEKLQ